MWAVAFGTPGMEPSGCILHYSDGEWDFYSPFKIPMVDIYNQIGLDSADHGFIVGRTEVHPTYGLIFEYDDSLWGPNQIPDLPYEVELRTVDAVDSNTAYIGGQVIEPDGMDQDEELLLLEWDGTDWSRVIDGALEYNGEGKALSFYDEDHGIFAIEDHGDDDDDDDDDDDEAFGGAVLMYSSGTWSNETPGDIPMGFWQPNAATMWAEQDGFVVGWIYQMPLFDQLEIEALLLDYASGTWSVDTLENFIPLAVEHVDTE